MSEPLHDMAAGDAVWVEEGMRVGESLENAHLVLVLGDDTRTTALAALGVARGQSGRRRVALGDLLGDAEPIQQLLNSDDPHGLADSFLYGVSLNKIARPVPQFGDLYILPTGSEVPGYEDIFRNSRWRRIAAGFRETGSLFVVAAPASAEHLDDIVDLTDGVVLVGDATVPGLNGEKLVGRVAPVPEAAAAAPFAQSDAEPWPVEPAEQLRRFRLSPVAVGGGVLALVLIAVGIWLAASPRQAPSSVGRSSATSAGTVSSSADSIHSDSLTGTAPSLLVPANPADSASAAAYAVVVARFNTQSGATIWLQTQARSLPSPTLVPFRVNGETWYRAVVGSYPTRAQADSLLVALSASRLTRPDSANVIRAPLAFLVDSVTAEAVPEMLKYFASRGQPFYALRQADGSARLYGGAFESPIEAALYLENFPSGGTFRPVLVYRIGRVF